jgi:hypothetical protein
MADDISKAVASESKNGRKATGASGPGIGSYGPSKGGTAVPKANQSKGGGADIGSGTATHRAQTSERLGAAYKVKQVFPPQTPESQPTQANGKIIPPTHRAGKGFWSQATGL